MNTVRAFLPQSENVHRAFSVLSDGAFRVYFHFCSTADLDTRKCYCTYDSLASAIERSRRSIATYLSEMQSKGVCAVCTATNQHEKTEVEICDPYWPFQDVRSGALNGLDFIQDVRTLLMERACIATQFHTHEQNLANSLRLQGISISIIERAIHLGCARRYLHLLNTGERVGISSFFYFQELVAEVTRAKVSDNYWEYIRCKLHIFEEQWKSDRDRL